MEMYPKTQLMQHQKQQANDKDKNIVTFKKLRDPPNLEEYYFVSRFFIEEYLPAADALSVALPAAEVPTSARTTMTLPSANASQRDEDIFNVCDD
jgi:hypothetical protein